MKSRSSTVAETALSVENRTHTERSGHSGKCRDTDAGRVPGSSRKCTNRTSTRATRLSTLSAARHLWRGWAERSSSGMGESMTSDEWSEFGGPPPTSRVYDAPGAEADTVGHLDER